MKREKYTFNGDTKTAINEVEKMLRTCFGHTNLKIISKKVENNGILYYPACRFMGNDDMAGDITITVRKVNNTTTSIKLEDSEYLPKDNWRRLAMNKCYVVCRNMLPQICK